MKIHAAFVLKIGKEIYFKRIFDVIKGGVEGTFL